MDRIAFMKAYCRIVELGSLSAAANDIGLSTSQLSRELKAEEESLGTSLLNRNTRNLSQTGEGQYYYEEAQRLLGELNAFDEHMRKGRQKPRGVLRINAPLSFGVGVLAPLIPEFRAQYPDIDLALNLEDRVVDMVEGGFDLSIRVRADLPDSGLRVRQLGMVHPRLCAAPGYFKDRDRPTHPNDLPQYDLVTFTLNDPPGVWEFEKGAEAITVPAKAGLAVNNSLFIVQLLEAGQGIGSLPDFIADPLIASGAIELVLPDWKIKSRMIYSLSASRTGSDGKALAFLDFLAEKLKS